MTAPAPNAAELADVLRQLGDRTNQTWFRKRSQWADFVRAQDARIAELEARLPIAIAEAVAVALDPAVSSDAQALIDRGAALAQQVPEPPGDPHEREPIDQSTIDCWRINYGLDKRTPAEAAKWWQDSFHGHAPSGCVAALGVALDELEAERKSRGAQQVPAVPGWVSVTERLPEKNTEVLIAFAGQNTLCATGQYTGSSKDVQGWCYPWENRGATDNGDDPVVTHWMDLPAAPLPTPADNAQLT